MDIKGHVLCAMVACEEKEEEEKGFAMRVQVVKDSVDNV